ncbi:hypothetical protein RvY_08668-2 [Ramazzottius varieornatus]|uniref:G-protein coupled receptors family 1 profile domain-containing protein n=1 Tax=Ramazzottius varieornatus TaxID=947166 RepID=A0A1D1VBB1_RAMVA|nr:hypothetical protein RvY_08668-2 [Ramazzottius varieornatus]
MFVASVNYGHDPDGNIISQSAWCAIHYSISTQLAPLFIYSSVSFYVVPLLVLTILYVSIAVFMRDVRKSQESTPSQSPTAAGYGPAKKRSKKTRTYLNRHESSLLTHNRQKSLKVLCKPKTFNLHLLAPSEIPTT